MATTDKQVVELLEQILRVQAIQVASGKGVTEAARLLKLADLDNQTIADFMKAMASSKYFNNVELVETTQGAGASSSLKKFSLKTKIVYRPPEAAPLGAKSNLPTPPKKEEKKR